MNECFLRVSVYPRILTLQRKRCDVSVGLLFTLLFLCCGGDESTHLFLESFLEFLLNQQTENIFYVMWRYSLEEDKTKDLLLHGSNSTAGAAIVVSVFFMFQSVSCTDALVLSLLKYYDAFILIPRVHVMHTRDHVFLGCYVEISGTIIFPKKTFM